MRKILVWINAAERALGTLRLRKKASAEQHVQKCSEVSRSNPTEPKHRRYLSDKKASGHDKYIQAAAEYVENIQAAGLSWLHCKPYQLAPGNPDFYIEMYQGLNLINAMEIPYRGRVLEVGSGPGWISEILVALGYEVHGIDPSPDMNEFARNRVRAAIRHWQITDPPPFEFYSQSLEECTLASSNYDAILFHSALHHVVDENIGLRQCFRLLRPGGVIGVCEGAWEPGNVSLEAELDAEMARYGTLENPFTRSYLDHLLELYGFTQIQRYHSINGFIPEGRGMIPVKHLAQIPAHSSNNLTAVKPGGLGLTTRHSKAINTTKAQIVIASTHYSSDRSLLIVKLVLKNAGKSTWLQRSSFSGQVTVAVRTDPLDSSDFRELPRSPIPHNVKPGEEVTVDLRLPVTPDDLQQKWFVDLVAENCFWFSSHGTSSAAIVVPES